MADETVRFQFFGVCTHIKPEAIAPRYADWRHRVVLVNASDPARFAHDPRISGIEPHHATLQILKRDMKDEEPPDRPWFRLSPHPVRSDTYEWMLEGVFLKVVNWKPTDPDEDEVENCMPHVQSFVDRDFLLTTTGPRGYLADPELTSCFVDLPRQSLKGRLLGQASVGVLDVVTDGPPEIRVIGFGGELLHFRLNHGAQVSVCNLPNDSSKDDDRDFFLHLLLVPGSFPVPVGDPVKTCSVDLTTDNAPVRITQITTAACSNSNYP